jgi:hypothetical protein
MGGTHPARRFEMRRGFGWGAAILAVLLLVGVGIGAYNWGVNEGLEQSGQGVEVVRYVGGHGFGFFPFFLFFPLFFLALFAFKGAMWRRHGDHDHGPGGHDHGSGGHGPGGHGPGSHGRWEQGYEEWHRRQHEGEGGGSSVGGEPV